MTTTIDFDSLEAVAGPRVVLMGSTLVGPLVTGADFDDFSVFASVYFTARASLRGSARGPGSLVVTIEHSDDGNSWSTAATLTFGQDGEQAELVTGPKAHVRAKAVAAASEWQLVSVEAAPTYLNTPGGGSLPAGGTTGQVLTKASNADGDADWEESGGSMPEDEQQHDLLGTAGTAPEQPTFTDLLSVHPQLLSDGWKANYDYAAAFGSTTSDVVQYLHPAAVASVFVAEVTATPTGDSEPDWSGAPNPGDTVDDNGITWVNAGLFSAFPPAPTTWQAETQYDLPAMVWPTVPNGRLYLMFPPGPLTSDVSEPDFDSLSYGEYVSDNDGYWLDAGTSSIAPFLPAWVRQVNLVAPDLLSPAATITARNGAAAGGLRLVDEAAGNNVVEFIRGLSDLFAVVSRMYIGDADSNNFIKWDGFGTLGLKIDFDGFVELQSGGSVFFHGESPEGERKIRFFDDAPATARPEVPATPTEQQIVDALVALGLVTQAAP